MQRPGECSGGPVHLLLHDTGRQFPAAPASTVVFLCYVWAPGIPCSTSFS